MRLTILQTSLAWENPAANREMFFQKLVPLRGTTDLVLLPEMFTTGFSMNAAALAEPMDGPTLQWLARTAETLDAALAGSFICRENGHFYNRLVFMRPDGRFETYDKRHLFTLAGEHDHFTPGNQQLVVEWQGWRIRPLVCYDLRFPVWSRNMASSVAPLPASPEKPRATPPLPVGEGPGGGSYDLLLYVANWPSRRAHHWRSLLTARAIENQAYTAGVNIVGADGSGLEYVGDSAVIDFSGQSLAQISGQEGFHTAKLSLDDLRLYRRQLPFLNDADVFQLCG